jgi:hypothetical protein
MDSAAAARTEHQRAGHDEAAPRLAIILRERSGSGCANRVEAPDRVLRMWSLLNTADEELHHVTRPGAVGRLQRQLEAVTAELERSVSPTLASELHHLVGHGGTVPITLPELRIEYASVLGWAGGLVIAMLSELATASVTPARLASQHTAYSSVPA